MGMFKGKWTCSTSPSSSAPNPSRFTVKREEKINQYWVSEIVYPDCKNFEGRKIIVSRKQPSKEKTFDPHFSLEGNIIARFNPDNKGWKRATDFVMMVI